MNRVLVLHVVSGRGLAAVWLPLALAVAVFGCSADPGGGEDAPKKGIVIETENGETSVSIEDDDGLPTENDDNGFLNELDQEVDCDETPEHEDCLLVATEPACGDGALNREGEACDDGNTLPGDGCNGRCVIEAHFECRTPGEPCKSLFACGNGIVEPGEVCDDGNVSDSDGCDSTCTEQHASYICPNPGQPCTRQFQCGDSRINGGDTCDDGNQAAGDGCDAECAREPGWVCRLPGQPCEPNPRCGDGVLDVSLDEQCDDGNVADSDGCSIDCLVEAGYVCPMPGEACRYTVACGDGIVTFGAEECDDGNPIAEDGCDGCVITAGYECPFPGAPCLPKCGDGVVLLSESCDDGNTDDGDGCTATCEWEDGWVCDGDAPNYSCRPTKCGDAVREGTEPCDDGNNVLGDGCTPLCGIEPVCLPTGSCTSTCGDGLLTTTADEVCDDGNTLDHDGCSASCKVEPGYECELPPLGDQMVVPVVYRDFTEAHPDFEPDALGEDEAVEGLIGDQLDAEGKPTLTGSTPSNQGHITSQTTFSEWYRDTSSSETIVSSLVLYAAGNGAYVNRWGDNGEQWIATVDTGDEQGGYGNSRAQCETTCTTRTRDNLQCENVCRPEHDLADRLEREYDQAVAQQVNTGVTDEELEDMSAEVQAAEDDADACDAECQDLFDSREAACQESCLPCSYNADQWCIGGEEVGFDGNPVFFPVDGEGNTPNAQLEEATIPPEYGGNWNDEGTGVRHNFHFTSEVRYWFQYQAGGNYTLDFLGDDDVWVFIAGQLALDLGGIHIPASGTVTLNAATANTLGLRDGEIYETVVFQAERQKTASSYKLTLSGFNPKASDCHPICGDAIVAPGEACDNGDNPGGYNACNPDCTRGEYCGDGTVNGPEDCDDGVNVDSYGSDGCGPGCTVPASCGDGVVQQLFGERCDLGQGNNVGGYGGCSSDCQRAPFCGDAVLDTDYDEECDDGINDGTYNTCGVGCALGPRCGDGSVQDDFGEQCDDGNNVAGDGCSPNCREEGVCGDAFVETKLGEACDDGLNDGGYGECAPGCVFGPRCGDGVTQSDEGEECDGGENPVVAYGDCAPGCVRGPHCGDGERQKEYESCDDGNNVSGDGCSSACVVEVRVQK